MSLLPANLRGVTATSLSSERILMLKSRGISDDDFKAIAPALRDNAALNQLYLGYNDFGDEGARLLCEALAGQDNSQLELLGLRHCRIGNSGASAIADLLRQSASLKELGIDENQIGDAGAETIAEAIRENTILQDLYIGNNNISKEGQEKLKAAKPASLRLHFER